MSLHLASDIPWWLGVTVAVLAVALTAWLYHAETHRRLSPGKRAPLMALRCSAVGLMALVLTGPVLTRRNEVEQKRRVEIFLDGSASMGIDDRFAPVEQKLLAARGLGLIPKETLDTSLMDMAHALAQARQSVSEARRLGSSMDALRQGCSTFAKRTRVIAARMESSKSPLGRRFDEEMARPAEDLALKAGEQTNPVQVRTQLNSLVFIAGRFEGEIRDAFAAYARQLAQSNDAAVRDALAQFDRMSRWDRGKAMLLGSRGELLRALAAKHDVEIVALAGPEAQVLWTSSAGDALPTTLPAVPSSAATDLITGVERQLAAAQSALPAGVEARIASVVISDGQHNQGASPADASRAMGNRKVPVYTLCLGDQKARPDLAVVDVRHNPVVFADDTVRGDIVVRDDMPAGKSFNIRIECDGEVLWKQELTTQGAGLRRVPVSFSVAQAADRKVAAGGGTDQLVSIALEMAIKIDPVEGEFRTDNNQRPMYVIKSAARTARILVIDGRPRWEMRYIRNMFARDPRWEINTLVLQTPGDLKTGDGPGMFPGSREAVFGYDLVAFGEVQPRMLSDEQLQWLRDFVRVRGGGMVLIDGSRRYLRSYADSPLAELLPVTWDANAGMAIPKQFSLTDQGSLAPFLNLASGTVDNAQVWNLLQPPHRTVVAHALPGGQTLVELTGPDLRCPALVLRRVGAGQVFYSAFDETWRWRYEVADEFHARYWNQVGNWIMERPYAAADKHCWLDVADLVQEAGKPASIRARLRDPDGKPITSNKAWAVTSKDGREIGRVALAVDEAGVYRGVMGPLSEGRYELKVVADGIAEDRTRPRLYFTAVAPESPEMTALAANPALLREMAANSGGEYLEEWEAQRLPGLLEDLGSKRIVESELRLWQSYWWFVPVVLLLALELVIRKKHGIL